MRIELVGDDMVLAFAPTPRDLMRVRSLPARRFDAATGRWVVPHTRENWAAMSALGFDLSGLPAPSGTGYTVRAERGLLVVKTPWSARNAEALRRLPDYRMWDARRQAWFAKPTRRNLEHLRSVVPQASWDGAAEGLWRERAEGPAAAAREYRAAKAASSADDGPDDYKHGGPPPFDWQRRCFRLSRGRAAFAIFAEQRTGKTKVVVDTAAWLYTRGEIRRALVIAPNSVKDVWVADELPAHMPDYVPWSAAAWKASPTKADRAALDAVTSGADRLAWLVMNVEALSTERGAAAAADFVKAAPCLVAVDESTRIKTPRSRRTRAVLALRRHAPYRRVLTGTPATQGPLDLYAQMAFLDPAILGFGSFYAFRNHFAIMGGFNGKVVVGYSHLDELQALIDPHSFRVTRDDCFDLPPKGYQKLVVEMGPDQRRLYDEMRDRMRAELGDGRKVTARLALTQMLRLAQIAGGFVPLDEGADVSVGGEWGHVAAEPIPGPNPKVGALLELAGDTQGKMVVWARFRAEVAAASAALRAAYGGDAVVEFHGGVSTDDRTRARTAFQDPGSPVRFMVGQTETGGLGINLDQARTVAYLSNSFSLESRLQSEDRPMSGRQRHGVAVVDIIARGTVDERIVAALRAKQDVARSVTGDNFKEWI